MLAEGLRKLRDATAYNVKFDSCFSGLIHHRVNMRKKMKKKQSAQGQHEEEDEEKAKCSGDESTSMIKELGSNDQLSWFNTCDRTS
ncbi:hypothetical protein Tco_1464376 [Tanacetum coccineum]